MPSVYTHFLVAREAFKSLPPEIQNVIRPHLSLYFFGAQGPDFCFFYKFLRPRKRNLGSYLHRKGGYDAFRILQRFSKNNPLLFSYAAGYVTHYATDVLFHPFVYAVSEKSLLAHSRIEGALDAHYIGVYGAKCPDGYERHFRKKLTKNEESELFALYAAIAANAGFPPLLKPSFSRAIRLFNAYLPLSFGLFGEKKPRLISAVFGKEKYAVKAGAVFQGAVIRSKRLIQEFSLAAEQQIPLSRERFGKNYLSGE